MKKISSYLFFLLVLSVVVTSCGKKKYQEHMDIKDAPTMVNQPVDQKTGEPVNPEAGHEYLDHKDITNNKQTCKMCKGSGKYQNDKCPNCQGYGYILVYE